MSGEDTIRGERAKHLKEWFGHHGFEVALGLLLLPFGAFVARSIYQNSADISNLSANKTELISLISNSEERLAKQIASLEGGKSEIVAELEKAEARLEKQISTLDNKGGQQVEDLKVALKNLKKVIYRITMDPDNAKEEIEKLIGSESDFEIKPPISPTPRRDDEEPKSSVPPPVHPAPRPPSSAPRPDSLPHYVVRAGDTLTVIARSHGVSVAALRRANGIGDADKLQVNQKLRIPR